MDELSGERIDIVRWDEDPEVLIPNALQPAEVDQVLLCDMLGRAIVLVREDQLSLAIGRRGQNVRLASKLCGWDIEIMTADELDEQIERAVEGFSALDGVDEELAQRLVEQGYLSYDDLSVIEPDALMEMGGLTEEQVNAIVDQAEARAEEAERAAAAERRRRREQERAEKEAAEADPDEQVAESDGEAAETDEADSDEQAAETAEAMPEGEVAEADEAGSEAGEEPVAMDEATPEGEVTEADEVGSEAGEEPVEAGQLASGAGEIADPVDEDAAAVDGEAPEVDDGVDRPDGVVG